jgi:Asp-tRNA(Asn)/Glu-tRNA(Gln) amidotransferase C subunit
MELNDELKEKQKEISEKIGELSTHFKTIQEAATENIEEMNTQLKDNFEKMKSFAESWFKK